MDRLEEIKQREREATRGPWVINGFHDEDEESKKYVGYRDVIYGPQARITGEKDNRLVMMSWVEPVSGVVAFSSDASGYSSSIEFRPEDREFILKSREDIPWLIRELEAAKEKIRIFQEFKDSIDEIFFKMGIDK